MIKRILDIILASMLLVLLSPMLVILSVIVAFTSPGPVIYRQIRVGQSGFDFTMYKFRSMDADNKKDNLINEATGKIFKIKDDPRLTAFGRFMRRWCLDEWPQLLNVINGDMSLVGPRPPLPEEVRKYNAKEFHRLDLTPGITGLWQVDRNGLFFDEMVDMDEQYIKKHSLLKDFKILIKTIPSIIKGKGVA